jgi:K+-transporting ATPase ATPase C chain
MKSLFRPALSLFVLLSILTGLVYPALVTALAQGAFKEQANGSLIDVDGKTVGSALLGQPFSDAKNFWSRPSATSPNPYNDQASGGSNLAASNPALADAVKDRIKTLRDSDASFPAAVPADLVTTSASGLDPDISPAAALAQVPRVAKARGVEASLLTDLVNANTEGRQFGFLGEPRVNVLKLNLALAQLKH